MLVLIIYKLGKGVKRSLSVRPSPREALSWLMSSQRSFAVGEQERKGGNALPASYDLEPPSCTLSGTLIASSPPAQQFDQGYGIPTVGLDSITRALRNHRWRNDVADVAKLLSMQSISRRSRLVAKMQALNIADLALLQAS
jgi:hypothetical protein